MNHENRPIKRLIASVSLAAHTFFPLVSVTSSAVESSRALPAHTGRDTISSPTLQTFQEPILPVTPQASARRAGGCARRLRHWRSCASDKLAPSTASTRCTAAASVALRAAASRCRIAAQRSGRRARLTQNTGIRSPSICKRHPCKVLASPRGVMRASPSSKWLGSRWRVQRKPDRRRFRKREQQRQMPHVLTAGSGRK
jgi:hypothetical protein